MTTWLNGCEALFQGAVLCAALTPVSACHSGAVAKACDYPITLGPTAVKPGGTLHVTITKPSCFDAMSSQKQKNEKVWLAVPGANNLGSTKIIFTHGKFTHDFVIAKTAKPGKATLFHAYQCDDNESCASQEVSFTVTK